jgi:hypothetical protein
MAERIALAAEETDDCGCGRGPVVGLLTYTNSRVLFRAVDEGTPTRDQSAADLRCLDCVADAVASVASGEVRDRMRSEGRTRPAYKVFAYSGKRSFHLRQPSYSKTVHEEPGRPPARERAEAVRRELAERSHRQRLGWTHIDIQPVAEGASDG